MIFMTSIIVGMTDSEILLRVLREVGLVDVREDGRHRLYRLNGQPLKPIHDWLRHYERMWNARFDALDEVLDELNDEEAGDGGKGR
jgi:DNA-binding transcriptional ArsR family regulator